MKKIYCVEDDESVRELVVYALQSSGFESQGFTSADEFFPAVKKSLPDLILLDIMLPKISGMEILNCIRKDEQTKNIPVIMLTARGSEYDKIAGLDSGADDYVAKPFGVMELIARIKAVLRRSSLASLEDKLAIASKDLVAGNSLLKLNYDFHKVYVEDREVVLTLKEFELLHYLLQNKNIVITRDKIMDEVWDYNYISETRTVDVHIKTLRHKLGVAGKLIETIRGVGYKITDEPS